MNDKAQPAEANKAWAEFMETPLGYLNPQRLSACLGTHIPDGLCVDLLSNQRLKSRLSSIVTSHYALPPLPADVELSGEDRAIALAPTVALQQIVLFAGAIFWSAAIVNTVRASEVVTLQSQIGEELWAGAMRHRELAGPMQTFASLDNVAESITDSGRGCLNAWCAAMDPAISARIRIKLTPDEMRGSFEPASYAEIGPAIIRRAGAEVL